MPMLSRLIAAVLTTLPASLALAWMPEPPPGNGPSGYGYPGFPPSYGYPQMGPPGLPWAPPGRIGPQAPGSESQGGPASRPEAQPSPTVPEAAAQPQSGGVEPGTAAPGQEPPAAQAPGAGPDGTPSGAPFGYPYGPRPYAGPGERQRVMPGQLRVTREVTDDAYLVHILVGDGKTEEVQVTPLGRSLAISRSADAQTLQEDSFDQGRGYQRSFSYARGAVSRRVGIPPDADLGAMTREVSGSTITLRIPRTARGGWGQGYTPGQPPMPGAMPQGMGPALMAPPTPEAPQAPVGQP